MNRSNFTLCLGSEQDLDVLTDLNIQLNEEFKYDQNLSDEDINIRMRNNLNTIYVAYIFKEGEKIVGYSLVEKNSNPLIINQFYIIKSARGRGYINVAVLLMQEATNTSTIKVESLVWRSAVGCM